MRSVASLVESLQKHEETFFSFIFNNQSEDGLRLMLDAFSIYFKDSKNSLKLRMDGKISAYDSDNEYLSATLALFFRNAPKELAEKLVDFLKSDSANLDARSLEELLKLIIIQKFDKQLEPSLKKMTMENLQSQIIATREYKEEHLTHFLSDQNFEDVIPSALNFAADYNTSEMLWEDTVKFIAWSVTAQRLQMSKDQLIKVPSSYSIHQIHLAERDLKSKEFDSWGFPIPDYFSIGANNKSLLEALHATWNLGCPAFLTCSNGGHWATIALVPEDLIPEGKKLHLLTFNSNKGTMLNDFTLQLVAEIKKMRLFNSIDSSYTFPDYVQLNMNCGLAAGIFIGLFAPHLVSETKMDLDTLKDNMPEIYKKFVGDTKSDISWLKVMSDARRYVAESNIKIPDDKNPLVLESNLSLLYSRPLYTGFNLDFYNQRYRAYYMLQDSLPRSATQSAGATPESSLPYKFLYLCYTILSAPGAIMNSLINLVTEVGFMIKCIYNDKPLEGMVQKYIAAENAALEKLKSK